MEKKMNKVVNSRRCLESVYTVCLFSLVALAIMNIAMAQDHQSTEKKAVVDGAEGKSEKNGWIVEYCDDNYNVLPSKNGAAFSRNVKYKDGQVCEKVTEYYMDGKKRSVFISDIHDPSTPNGSFLYYYGNGKMQCEGVMDNGKQVGWWKFYHENGNLSEESYWIAGRVKGVMKRFHENGKLKQSGNMIPDPNDPERMWKHGEITFYDLQGKKLRTVLYENGSQVRVVWTRYGFKSEKNAIQWLSRGTWQIKSQDKNYSAVYKFTGNELIINGRDNGLPANERYYYKACVLDHEIFRIAIYTDRYEASNACGYHQKLRFIIRTGENTMLISTGTTLGPSSHGAEFVRN